MKRLYQLVFDPTGTTMIVARGKAPRPVKSEYEIVVEKTANGARVCALDVRSGVSPPTISFSRNGRYIVGSGSRVMGKPAECKEPQLDIWDAQTGRRIWDPNQPVPYPIAEFEQCREALLQEVGNGRLSRTSAEADLKLLFLLCHVRDDGEPLVVDGAVRTHGLSYFSPDGDWIVTRDGILPDSDYSSEAVIWDARRCQLVCEFDEDDIWTEPFIFSRDGAHFLRRAHEQPRRIYESVSGQPVDQFTGLPNAECLALAPNGKKAILGTRQEAVLFDAKSGRIIKGFAVPGSQPRRAQFSPDGKRAAIEFRDHSVDRLNSDEFRDRVNVCSIGEHWQELFCVEPPPLAHRYRWYPVAFNADGTRLLYGGALWDANSGNKIRQFGIVYD